MQILRRSIKIPLDGGSAAEDSPIADVSRSFVGGVRVCSVSKIDGKRSIRASRAASYTGKSLVAAAGGAGAKT